MPSLLLLLLPMVALALAPPFSAVSKGAPRALFYYVDSAPNPGLLAAPSRPKIQQAQPTQVSPRPGPGSFVVLDGRISANQAPIVSEDRVNPGSVYHQRIYHNRQKIPLIKSRAQAPPRGTFFGAALPPISSNLGFKAPTQLQQIDRPSSLAPEEEEEEEEDDDDDEAEEAPEDSAGDNSPEPEADEEEEDEDEDEDKADEVERHFFNAPAKFSKFKYESELEDGDESKQRLQYHQSPQSRKRAGQSRLQGGYSQQVPVAHKQKIYKERWYLSKDLEGVQ